MYVKNSAKLQKLPQKKYNVGYYNTKEDNLVKSRHSGLSGIGCFCNALGRIQDKPESGLL